jgi:hypothetical protein
MTQQTINLGTTANDGSGDPLRTAFTKINANFTDLYTQITTLGTGTSQLVNGSYSLQLGTDGTLNLPLSVNGQGVIQTPGSYYLDANGAVYGLGSNGTFTLPTGGIITDSNNYLTTLNLYVQGSLKGVDGSTGSTGQVLTRQSNGGVAWGNISASSILPSYSGNAGKFLTTDGSTGISWASVSSGLPFVKSGFNIAQASVTLGNLTATFTSTGTPEITNAGSSQIYFSYNVTMNINGSITSAKNTIGITAGNSQTIGSQFSSLGDTSVAHISDTNNDKIYRVTWIAGPGIGSGNGTVMIEEIV